MNLSTPALSLMRRLTKDYVTAGFPDHNNCAFSLDGDHVPYNELAAVGLIVPFTTHKWKLTDAGVEWVMEHRDEHESASGWKAAERLASLPTSMSFLIEYPDAQDRGGPLLRTKARVTLAAEVDLREGAVSFAIHKTAQHTIRVPFEDLAALYRDGTWVVHVEGSLVVEPGPNGDHIKYVRYGRVA